MHGPDLGCAAEGAGREGGSHQVEGRALGRELAVHLRDDVHHVAVALDDHQVTDGHAAILADSTDVVTGQVYEHYVLGALLGISQKLLLQGQVFRLISPATTGASDGSDFHGTLFATHMQFGRGPDQCEAL